jgi:hypothetical protein
MSDLRRIRRPAPTEVPYRAGEYLFKNGPVSKEGLFLAVPFPHAPLRREDALQRAIRAGWLIETLDGKIACSSTAIEFYEDKAYEAATKPMGQVAGPRNQVNLLDRPSLSKKNMPNSRGIRQDIPKWSERPVGFGFKSIAGGGE